ncbi:MAG: sulfurtransferase-like selenium metabolism protein YedF [Desulfovibrio sp.]
MSVKNLDCQGLPCPQPVIKCKEAAADKAVTHINVTVDNAPANENVTRFLTTQGFTADSEKSGDVWKITAVRNDVGETNDNDCAECEVMTNEQIAQIQAKTTVFITSEFLGKGDDELGGKLMFNFIATLPEMQDELFRIVLVNSGVKLACAPHPCLEKLQDIANAGTTVLVCGTCLEHFGVLDKKEVGDTTNMLDVVTSLQVATKVITI